MLSSNPLSGIYKADTSRTLDQNGGNPSCNQGGLLVLEPIPESKFEASLVVLNDQGGESMSVEKSDLSPTLRCETHGHLPIVACRHCHGPYMGNGAVGVHQGQDGNVNISDAAYTLSTYGTASCRNAPLIVYIKPRNQERQTGASGFTSKGNGDCSLTHEYHCTISQGGGQAGQGYPAVLVPCPDVHCNDETYIQPEATGTLVASGAGMSRPGGMASEPDLYVAYKRPVFALQGNMIGRQEQNGPMGSGVNEDVCFTVTATDVGGVAAVFNMQRSDTFSEEDVASTQSARQYKNATDLVCEANQLIDGPSGGDEKSTASDCDGPTACGQSEVSAVDCRNFNEFGDISGTLQSKGKSGYSLNYQNPVRIPDKAKYIVRRLTPTECERLQGYPDGWTKNGHDGKEISDTRRYQMLGNSVAIPCVIFVLGGIVAAECNNSGFMQPFHQKCTS
jgi:DNA (cytosine-5)-methyltransferase 1